MQPISWLYGTLSNALSHAKRPFLAISCRLDHDEPRGGFTQSQLHNFDVCGIHCTFSPSATKQIDEKLSASSCNQITLWINHIRTSETRWSLSQLLNVNSGRKYTLPCTEHLRWKESRVFDTCIPPLLDWLVLYSMIKHSPDSLTIENEITF